MVRKSGLLGKLDLALLWWSSQLVKIRGVKEDSLPRLRLAQDVCSGREESQPIQRSVLIKAEPPVKESESLLSSF